jgi:copper(I)-binding protein
MKLIRLGGGLLALAAALIWTPASAAPPISVEGAWCWISPLPHTAYVYMTLTLTGETADNLLSAATTIADGVELLAPRRTNGREGLERTDSIPLERQAPTILQPYGQHIIMRQVKDKLVPDTSFPLKLTFEKAGEIDIPVKIVKDPPIAGMPNLPKSVKLE